MLPFFVLATVCAIVPLICSARIVAVDKPPIDDKAATSLLGQARRPVLVAASQLQSHPDIEPLRLASHWSVSLLFLGLTLPCRVV